MFFYISFIALSAFSFDFARKYTRNARFAVLLFLSIIFIGNIIFLTNLPDISTYEKSYDMYRSFRVSDDHMEVAYRCISNFFADLGIPFFAYRFLLIFCSVLLFFRGIIRLSEQFSVSVIYFYTCVFVISYLIQIRVGLGLSVFIGIGLPAYCKKKNICTFLSIIAASLFHTSMLMLFFPIFLTFFPRSNRCKSFFLVCGLLFAFFNVFDLFLEITDTYFLHTKIISYINQSGNKDASLSVRDILNFLLLFIFSTKTNESRIDNFMFWSLFCGFILKIVFRNFGEIGVRFNLLFSYSLIFLMPLLCKDKNVLKTIGIYLFSFVNFYFWITNYGSGSIVGNSGIILWM